MFPNLRRSALLALGALSPTLLAAQGEDSLPAASTPEVLRGLYGEVLGRADDPERALGGTLASPFGARQRISAVAGSGPGIYEVTLADTGTEWEETFLVGVPRQPLPLAPLLVVFHAYARTPLSTLFETEFFRVALERGWYVVAPLGAHKFNFSIPYAQQNVAAALRWTLERVALDPDRIYGVGFSMGGGMATTFAARHQDPNLPRFAALVDHTGTVSIRDEWNNVFDTSVLEHELMFGGGPDEYPFLYNQASTIDLALSGAVDQANDFARNLRLTPTLVFSVADDPLGYLVVQSDMLEEQLLARGGVATRQVISGAQHGWETLGESEVLDFFEPLRLAQPVSDVWYDTLIDRDGRWLLLDVERARAGELSQVSWRFTSPANRIEFEDVTNLARIRVDAAELEFDAGAPLSVAIETGDDEVTAIEIVGYDSLPSRILRDGQASSSWSYDATRGSVFLVEFDASDSRAWTVVP